MTTPERSQLQSSEYYLKYMSWHAKDMSTCLKEMCAAFNTLNKRLEGIEGAIREKNLGIPVDHKFAPKMIQLSPAVQTVIDDGDVPF